MSLELDQESLLHRITNRIRQSLELSEILTATVAEVCSFLATDRVMVYRFHADGSGEVIAEAIHNNRLPSLKGLNFPADDIPPHARELFLKARLRSIVNVALGQIGLSSLDNPETESLLTAEGIHYRPVDSCHIEYLTTMGVQSSLVVPIVCGEQLWGLLVSHHSEPRTVTAKELQFIQLVADQVSIAITQSNLLRQARAKAEREATINRVASLLHSWPTIQLQVALEETIAALQGSGGRLYIAPYKKNQAAELFTCGAQPVLPNAPQDRWIEQHIVWQKWLKNALISADQSRPDTTPLALTDLYKEPQLRVLAPAFKATQIRGILVFPLLYRQQFLGILSIFRDEVNTETLWAGRFDPDEKQQLPRHSFETWREIKKGQAKEWTAEALERIEALGHHFAMAIEQYKLYKQVQALNTDLENQVQERTAQLQHSLEFARVLKQVTDQIRSTLDLKTTLQAIVREVHCLLNTDRVIIYQFTQGWWGEVIVEELKGNCQSVLGFRGPEDCFPDEYARLYSQGRVQAINDVFQVDLTLCHRDFLQSIQVQANLVVPIVMGKQLWGLLIAHECQSPRVWHTDELQLLQQLASQAAIAIQQAEFYQQSLTAAAQAQAQAQLLEEAAEKQTALFRVVSKIRESLNLDTIFKATAREVRKLLDADRVGIFYFDPNSGWKNGEFVSEDVAAGFNSVLAVKVHDHSFGEQYAQHYSQGRIQAVADIYAGGIANCHVQILSQFQVRANLVLPLLKGEALWGLLCIHQCRAARNWQSSEIDFVTQIAAQLGVAIQQAELLTQTQQQAEQIREAFEELQQTQSQLIQTEKMSSLGQLVAGVAHEINNPVNFIYGNLVHIGQYIQDLLDLLKLYQLRHPESEVVNQAQTIDLEFLADDLPKILASMKVGAERIRQLVLSLRNFSRLDQAEMKPVDIHEGLDSTLLILQHRLKVKTNSPCIQVVKAYGNLPLVGCYAGQLNQVFMNVLSNAIDALEQRDNQRTQEEIKASSSEITITTSLMNDDKSGISRVVIQIADNGLGMTEAVQAQVFNPFFTTKPVGKGTGLGLSISYQIVVEKHGGVFKCNSQPGQGTEFWIEIPLQ